MSYKHTIALDLDGVLANYDGWKGIYHIGDPIPGAVDFCNKLSEKYKVVINTSRCSQDGKSGHDSDYLKLQVTKWLDKHGFKYDDVYTGQGKVIASAYVDDRAVSCRPLDRDGNLMDVYQDALDKTDYLCNYTSLKEKDTDKPHK